MPKKEKESRTKAKAVRKVKQIQHYQELDKRLEKRIESQGKKTERLKARIVAEEKRTEEMTAEREKIAAEIAALNEEK